jgi:hypothetical protein
MVNIDWTKLSKLEYWFEGVGGSSSITPPIEQGSWFFWFFLSFFTIIFGLGILIKLYKSFIGENHPLQNRLDLWGSNIIGIGSAGIAWVLLRQLSIGLLGARFWLFALLIWGLVILYFTVRYFILYFRIELAYYNKFGSLPLFKEKTK